LDLGVVNACAVFVVCSPVHFLTSGGGSKAWRGTKAHINAEEDFSLQFYYDAQGFAAVAMLPTEVLIDLYNISGQVEYSMNLQKIHFIDVSVEMRKCQIYPVTYLD
jgi:tartrate-resistant acid phosphatase type 5